MTKLRFATAADLPAINEIYNHYVLHSTCTYQTEPSTDSERAAWFAAHGEKYPAIVAERHGMVVGWGSLSKFHVRAAYENTVEDSIYIQHEFCGQGLGTTLLAELLRLAKEIGHHTVMGGADSAQTASIALHKKFGFEPVGHYKEIGFKFGQWLDVIWLQKML